MENFASYALALNKCWTINAHSVYTESCVQSHVYFNAAHAFVVCATTCLAKKPMKLMGNANFNLQLCAVPEFTYDGIDPSKGIVQDENGRKAYWKFNFSASNDEQRP